MTLPDPRAIRNLCLCGHSGSGKTTLCERLLFAAGEITRLGTVEEGNTVSDFSEEEREHRHSLQPSVMHFKHDGHHVNLIDTPGMADFIGHAIACFPAVESVVVVISAAKGIESQTRRLMQVATERKLPRMILINKIDVPEADLEQLTAEIREAFGDVCLPINLPRPDLAEVIDVFETDAHDATAFSAAEAAHTAIVEQVVQVDEELTQEYLEQGAESLDPQRVHDAFERALCEGQLVPIVYVSARTGAGIAALLHVTASLLPSPPEGNPPALTQGGQPLLPELDPEAPTLAHLFRISTDRHIGKLGIFRVHQGTVSAKSELYLDDQRKPLRIGHVSRLQGKTQTEVPAVGPGDIGAIAKINEIHFNGILHSGVTPEDPPVLLPPPLPQPMFGYAIQLRSHADEAKFSAAVQKLQSEDPSLVIERISATGETVLRGLGDLHLRVVLEKLRSQYGIELDTFPPKIAYKETITSRAQGHHRHKKQTGGAGQFGEVHLRVEPLPAEHPQGFEFINATVGGAIPRQFMPAIEKGIRQVLQEGAVAGYPIGGVRVEVFDGKYHDVDSKEIAFITAGKKAFIDAITQADPILLEPFVEIEVTAPAACLGDLASHLATHRGRVTDSRMLGSDTCQIRAIAPLSELQTYATDLKSLTAGAGTFTMQYSHDEPTPPHIQQAVIAAYHPQSEESVS